MGEAAFGSGISSTFTFIWLTVIRTPLDMPSLTASAKLEVDIIVVMFSAGAVTVT